jgi:hypothetical protein
MLCVERMHPKELRLAVCHLPVIAQNLQKTSAPLAQLEQLIVIRFDMDGKVDSQGHGNGFAFLRKQSTANWLMVGNQFLPASNTAHRFKIFVPAPSCCQLIREARGIVIAHLPHDYELVSEVLFTVSEYPDGY